MIGKLMIAIAAAVAVTATAGVKAEQIPLTDNWSLASSAQVRASGEEISRAGYDATGWHQTSVPATVLAALVAAGEYPDPFFGKNLQRYPGVWPPPFDVSSFSKPPWSPFRRAWWYRTEFELPAAPAGRRFQLHFNGLNYRANVFLNGSKIADAQDLAGHYCIHELDITAAARPGTNALAVQVFPPGKRDLAETWVDWNPAPPDRNMGLWREAFITASGPVTLRHPHVVSDLDPEDLSRARVTVSVEVHNASDQKVVGRLKGGFESYYLEDPNVELAPGETREIIFPAVTVEAPRLWWPYQIGAPELYDLSFEFMADEQVSDRASIRFGIREIEGRRTENDDLVIVVNGRRVLVRGAGWAPDMMFRWDFERTAAELRYVKLMNLNAVRLEGKLESDRFYELADELGIMVIAGWCCCHHWERWYKWDAEDHRVAEESQRSQIKRLRAHPSMVLWLNASDMPPPARVEEMYLNVLKDARWPNAVTSSASESRADFSGPSGVKMTGPYEYVPPVYWYEDTKNGGAWGFNTETSPGPAVPPLESLEAMLPPERLWPINDYWNYHAGRVQFGNINIYKKAQDARYGASGSAAEFALKSQAMAYELQRAMMEAYGRNKYTSTGVVQWMLNNAWPSLIWHLYDYYLRPGGGFFGTQKACEPLHVQYSYDDRSVAVVNSTYDSYQDYKVSARVLNFDLTLLWAGAETVNVGPDQVVTALIAPEPDGVSETYFLKLELRDPAGKLVSSNFYWLSTRPDTLNWAASTWFYTPAKTHADYTMLNSLPPAAVEAETEFVPGAATVRLKNPGPNLAFMVRLALTRGPGGDEILPAFWSDNYVSLLPGEETVIRCEYRLSDLGASPPALRVTGWNITAGP